jgi:hypothetical protein
MPTVRLVRVALPIWPCRAEMNSGRVAWFSISAGLARVSASTLPLESMMVARASAACATWLAVSCSGRRSRSCSTVAANRRTFCSSAL